MISFITWVRNVGHFCQIKCNNIRLSNVTSIIKVNKLLMTHYSLARKFTEHEKKILKSGDE